MTLPKKKECIPLDCHTMELGAVFSRSASVVYACTLCSAYPVNESEELNTIWSMTGQTTCMVCHACAAAHGLSNVRDALTINELKGGKLSMTILSAGAVYSQKLPSQYFATCMVPCLLGSENRFDYTFSSVGCQRVFVRDDSFEFAKGEIWVTIQTVDYPKTVTKYVPLNAIIPNFTKGGIAIHRPENVSEPVWEAFITHIWNHVA